MKHKYQTQYCACREFRFQHFVGLALDENFKKSKYRQRAQQLPFSLLIFSALWEGGGQWIRKSPGTFRSQTQRDRQTNKTETKTFSQLLLIFIKKLLDGNFHLPSEKFLWHRKQEMLQFSGVFHCHQYHFNQMKSLLYSLCLPMDMDAWMARNRCLLKKVELRDAESLYWPEMAYVEIPLMLNRSKKIIEAAYIHVRPVIQWLNCLECMRSCWDQMRQ